MQYCYRRYYLRKLGDNPKDTSDGQGTCSGVANVSGIVVTSAAEAGDPAAVVLVVWDSEDRRERRELGWPNNTPEATWLQASGSRLATLRSCTSPSPAVSVVIRVSSSSFPIFPS